MLPTAETVGPMPMIMKLKRQHLLELINAELMRNHLQPLPAGTVISIVMTHGDDDLDGRVTVEGERTLDLRWNE